MRTYRHFSLNCSGVLPNSFLQQRIKCEGSRNPLSYTFGAATIQGARSARCSERGGWGAPKGHKADITLPHCPFSPHANHIFTRSRNKKIKKTHQSLAELKKVITFALAFGKQPPTNSTQKAGAIAQMVEQRTENPCVPGSIPGGTT